MEDALALLIFFAMYGYVALSLQTIADKTGTENSWYAWIPIANIFLMCRIADKPGWWVLLVCLPLINIVIGIILWMEIAKARGKPEWLGVLLLVPIANIILPGYLAFSE